MRACVHFIYTREENITVLANKWSLPPWNCVLLGLSFAIEPRRNLRAAEESDFSLASRSP
jgi:hypothetical protein